MGTGRATAEGAAGDTGGVPPAHLSPRPSPEPPPRSCPFPPPSGPRGGRGRSRSALPGAGGPGRGGEVRGQDGTAPSRQRCTEGSGAPGVQRSVPGRTRAARGFSGAAQCPPGSRCRPRHALLPAADPDGAPAFRHAVRRHGPARLQPHLPAAGGADLSRERSRCRSRSAAGVRGRRFAAGVGRAGRALPRAQRELPPPLPPPRLLQHRAVPGAARARAVRGGGGAPRWGGGSSRDWKVWGAPGCSGPPGVQRKLGGVSLPPSPPVILSAPWGW